VFTARQQTVKVWDAASGQALCTLKGRHGQVWCVAFSPDGMRPNSAWVGLRPGRTDVNCDQAHFWSLHAGGANFLFADGSTHFFSYAADTVLPALATRNGGEAVSATDF
jgi:prepilin-type processing-associated H-X9-DG protein